VCPERAPLSCQSDVRKGFTLEQPVEGPEEVSLVVVPFKAILLVGGRCGRGHGAVGDWDHTYGHRPVGGGERGLCGGWGGVGGLRGGVTEHCVELMRLQGRELLSGERNQLMKRNLKQLKI